VVLDIHLLTQIWLWLMAVLPQALALTSHHLNLVISKQLQLLATALVFIDCWILQSVLYARDHMWLLFIRLTAGTVKKFNAYILGVILTVLRCVKSVAYLLCILCFITIFSVLLIIRIWWWNPLPVAIYLQCFDLVVSVTRQAFFCKRYWYNILHKLLRHILNWIISKKLAG